jgi:ubiquinone/menaquinone biosynthesis C-methylase UbiE
MIDSDKLVRWYDFQAPFYRRWRNDYSNPLLHEVAAILGEGPALILDAGCGTGLYSIGLARLRPQWNIEGFDVSEGMLSEARTQADKFGVDNVTFRHGDVAALDCVAGKYDAAVVAGLFPNLNDRVAAARQLRRVLRPAGGLVVVEFDRTSMSLVTRAFFGAMILGYKVVSTVLRRFRFADRWNLQTSTVCEQSLVEQLEQVGFTRQGSLRLHNHFVLHLTRDAAG